MGPVRTEVMWQAVVEAVAACGGGTALTVVDLGGGTGGHAVRLAGEGHDVTVVDPSPDALASLARRAVEHGVKSSLRGVLGDSADLGDHVGPGSVDLVLCHGLLEHVDDPGETLRAAATALRPRGVVSVVAANRLAAVVARALAGDFAAASHLVQVDAASWDRRADGPRRFTADELAGVLADAGFVVADQRALRVFTDLVPAALVDTDPSARERLYALEQLVTSSADFRALSAGVQCIARLDSIPGTTIPGGHRATV